MTEKIKGFKCVGDTFLRETAKLVPVYQCLKCSYRFVGTEDAKKHICSNKK